MSINKSAALFFTLALTFSSLVNSGSLANMMYFSGSWFSSDKGVPYEIELRRFGGATVGGRDCEWETASSLTYSDAINITCRNMKPIFAALMFSSNDSSSKFLITHFPTESLSPKRGIYYPSVEALTKKNKTLKSW